ncbi:MAG: type II secretion system protein [Myxococcales bacterium]|nr:type II secretion system protein [Myxococcales bacterium]
MTTRRQAFTLIEIVIALTILAVSLMVLVESQSGSVLQTIDSQRILTANSLAEAKLAEVLLTLEMDGFSDTIKGEDGSFEDFGDNGEYGEVVDFEGEYDEYGYAWTVRPVEMELGDIAGTLEELSKDNESSGSSSTSTADDAGVDASLFSAFLTPEAMSEMLSPWMREVRVVVWWGDDPGDLEADELCESCVELVSHVFNPSGTVAIAGVSQ